MNHHIVRNVGFALGLIPPIILVSLTNTYFNQSGLNFDKIMTAIISTSFGALPMIIGGAYLGYKKIDFYLKLKYVYAVAFSIIYVILFFHFGYQYVEKHFICQGEAGCLEEVSHVTPMVSNDEVPPLLRRIPQVNDVEDILVNHGKNSAKDMAASLTRQEQTIDELDNFNTYSKLIVSHAVNGNWTAFIDEIKKGKVGIHDEYIIDNALMLAVADLAPMEVIDKLLSMGGTLDVNYRHIAFHLNDATRFKRLVKKGLPLGSYDDGGHTPLTSCLSYPPDNKLLEILDYLLAEGVDVNWLDKSGNSPMSYVLNQPYNEYSADIIQTLLHHNAELTASDKATFLQVKVNQPDIFDELTALIPELLDYVE